MTIRLAISISAFSFLLVPFPALALDYGQIEHNLDMTWILAAAALVMFMQVGFLFLEAGMVRSKNSINVAQKNLLDFTFAVAAFAIIGFAIAFGTTRNGFFGFELDFFGLQNVDSFEAGFFVFQVMFCGTAATIVSGAVAERMRLSAYIISAVFLSVIVYPVFVHWAWGNALRENSGAILANLGFIDFAGSTVVHATGAWFALAACIVLGPREGRFDKNGNPVRFAGHSPVLATAGGLLLFVGWLGFNGGSTLKAGEDVSFIILNTILAGGFGAVMGHLLGYKFDGYFLPEKSINGMIGGLAAVTAGCAVLNPLGAIIMGTLGGAIAIYSNYILEHKFKIDDAVGAIGAHGFAGIAGTIALAFLAPAERLNLGRLEQLYIQMGGTLLNFSFCFVSGLIFFGLLKRLIRLRVNQSEELAGLNVAEHATRIGVGHIEDAMGKLVSGEKGFNQRLPAIPGDEAKILTDLFNKLMVNMENEHKKLSELEALKIQSEESERITALSNATFEGIAIHKNGVIIDGNNQLPDLLGYELDELVGSSITQYLNKDSQKVARKAMLRNTNEPYEVNLIAKSGEEIPVAVRSQMINYKGEDTGIVCLVDLRERKAAENKILHLAQRDALTGLANRSLFNEKLSSSVKDAKDNSSAAIILIDLDRFKNVNDVYGHQAGDLVIKEAARRLQSVAGPEAMIARLGGDEFAIILQGLSFANQANDIGHRIITQIAEPIPLNDENSVQIGASVGIALCPEHALEEDDIFLFADIALYHSKNTGRNTYNMYRDGLNELMEKRKELQADLEVAIQRDEFELYYQPRACAETLNINSYEALLRWHHPERGMVSPTEFIPVAEACGKIIEIDSWVFRQACLASLDQLSGKKISVNISPLQFQQSDFVSSIQSTLKTTGADPVQLEIELTESMLIGDDARALSVMKQLKQIGFSIALDDFGTGYSSLSYLSKYPFDTIKIDRSFVAALGKEAQAVAIMKAIIGLGAGLDMKIVAEGVETIEELLFLRHHHCNQLQGYLIGKPMPLETVVASISSNNVQVASLRSALRKLEHDVPGKTAELGQNITDRTNHKYGIR